MLRAMDKWLPGYIASVMRRPRTLDGSRHVLVCIADHFEPYDRTILRDGRITGGSSDRDARSLVTEWCERYRSAFSPFRDSDGCYPRHTFFYPWDEYDASCLDQLAQFSREGFGEVEIHLHHRNDTELGFRHKLEACRDTYAHQHGVLGRISGADLPAYAFVHGNWCLCNSRPDGDWCGVDRELSILSETGCYADFTFPSAPSPTQPAIVNGLYYGRDPRSGEKGHQVARMVVARPENDSEGGGGPVDSDLLMIPGPLGLNWRSRKWGMIPRLENGELSGANPGTVERLKLWRRIGIHVPGRPEWVVVKLHTHGADPKNRDSLLGTEMVSLHQELARLSAERTDFQFHYVTARELFNIIKAAESGRDGSPSEYRDYDVAPPAQA
jgi:hypothetical protein